MSDILYINLQGEVERQLEHRFSTQIDAEIWFGVESRQWTHEERSRRLVESLDGLWREKGGEGSHPMTGLYKKP